MVIQIELLLVKGEVTGDYKGSRQEIQWNMESDGLNILSNVKTTLTSNKARKFTILGLEYVFFFRDGKLYYRINSPEFNFYLNRLKQGKPEVIYNGYQAFYLKKLGKWQSVHINTINYNDKQYELIMLMNY